MSGSGMTGNTIDLGLGIDTVKFTEISTADTVTVTSTTVTGAKNVIYEKAATSAVITTGSGADSIVFKDQVSGDGVIATNSGNDSIQFLKASTFTSADLGAGADSVYGADNINNAIISTGAGAILSISTPVCHLWRR